ncbi:50S ribosomal protein L3 N(5)-glutamine methyltransferase [Marinicella meishanensis]|uniref:50S ribosomal protein L3 N(5)-glutamine methyltransferase n=1 Tax=Marinicella meishanensis TaxID=2873263 RepID=UPI001CC09CB9
MLPTVADIFKQSIDRLQPAEVFYGHGVAEAEDEVVLLLMHVLQLDFAGLNRAHDQRMTAAQIQRVDALLTQRVEQRIPMAYLVGFSVFAGLSFVVDQRVLIPRSPFAELIDQGFAPWVDVAAVNHALDMCTGSGCIGLAMAHYFPTMQLTLVDLSPDALDLARHNTKALGLSDRVQCLESDLFSHVSGQFDLIVANPPYVDEQEYRALPAEFSHEPAMALVSAAQGMALPIQILAQAADYLTAGGYLFLEVGYNDGVLERCLPTVPLEWIEFSLGGQGICVFSRDDLLKYRSEFNQFLQAHVSQHLR